MISPVYLGSPPWLVLLGRFRHVKGNSCMGLWTRQNPEKRRLRISTTTAIAKDLFMHGRFWERREAKLGSQPASRLSRVSCARPPGKKVCQEYDSTKVTSDQVGSVWSVTFNVWVLRTSYKPSRFRHKERALLTVIETSQGRWCWKIPGYPDKEWNKTLDLCQSLMLMVCQLLVQCRLYFDNTPLVPRAEMIRDLLIWVTTRYRHRGSSTIGKDICENQVR